MSRMARDYNTVLNVKQNLWVMRHRRTAIIVILSWYCSVIMDASMITHDRRILKQKHPPSFGGFKLSGHRTRQSPEYVDTGGPRTSKGHFMIDSIRVSFRPWTRKTERSEPRGCCLPPALTPQRQSNIFTGERVFSVIHGQPIVPYRRWVHHGSTISVEEILEIPRIDKTRRVGQEIR